MVIGPWVFKLKPHKPSKTRCFSGSSFRASQWSSHGPTCSTGHPGWLYLVPDMVVVCDDHESQITAFVSRSTLQIWTLLYIYIFLIWRSIRREFLKAAEWAKSLGGTWCSCKRQGSDWKVSPCDDFPAAGAARCGPAWLWFSTLRPRIIINQIHTQWIVQHNI